MKNSIKSGKSRRDGNSWSETNLVSSVTNKSVTLSFYFAIRLPPHLRTGCG